MPMLPPPLEKISPDRGVLVLVRRGDQTLFRVLKPSAKDSAPSDEEDEGPGRGQEPQDPRGPRFPGEER